MKTFVSYLSCAALALLTILTLSFASEAATLPVVNDASEAPPPSAECMQNCLNQLHINNRACASSCFICDYGIFGICFSGHHGKTCLLPCYAAALMIKNQCVEECF